MELIDIEYHPKGPKEEKSGDDGERNDSWAAWSANDGDEHAIYKVRLKRKTPHGLKPLSWYAIQMSAAVNPRKAL
jgi:hypothetical protein